MANWMLSLKVLLFSSGVLSMAVILKLSLPAIMEFAVYEVPLIWSFVVSWLKPPYLYLVINCIIITIVASSKFQSKVDVSPSVPEMAVLVQPEPIKISADVRTDYAAEYGGGVVKNEAVEFEYGHDAKASEFDVYGDVEARVSETKTMITVNALEEMNGGDDFVISKSSLDIDRTEYSFPTEKPLVSARFGNRKAVKAVSEGVKTLRVSRPKRQDTLESTWKTITDGRPMPLTRHLRNSDTWETHGRRDHTSVGHTQLLQTQQKMIKSETFSDRSTLLVTPSPGSGKLRKEPSPSQDELNRRVEAFIKNFNEDMRLQRQESLNQYMEMINRGAH